MAGKYAKALFEFKGSAEGDMSFAVNDVIMVVEEDDSGWWVGEHCTHGTKGEFPFNYVQLISKEEAERLEISKNSGQSASVRAVDFRFQGDPVDVVKVVDSEFSKKGCKDVFKIEVMTNKGKRKTAKKSISQFRDLGDVVCGIFPSFKWSLPPEWACHIKFEEIDINMQKKALQKYLMALLGTDTSLVLLLSWLFPGEKYDISQASPDLASAALAARKIGQVRTSTKSSPPMGKFPEIASVEFTWEPQDDAELFMQAGQFIAVLSQETGSPGWWEGETADGKRGLFPYNHVELLDPKAARSILTGPMVTKPQETFTAPPRKPSLKSKLGTKNRMSRAIFGSGKKKKDAEVTKMHKLGGKMLSATSGGKKSTPKTNKPKDSRRVVAPFTLGELEAFDCLIDNGFVMESMDGKMQPLHIPKNAPKDGDRVQLEYIAYTWDCQTLSLVEFATSDKDGEQTTDGYMTFTVGAREVIKGIEYAVVRIKKGEKIRLTVTPQLAYGAVGLPPDVPSHCHVVYDITLKDFSEPSTIDISDLPPPPPMEDRISAQLSKPPVGPKPVANMMRPVEPRAPTPQASPGENQFQGRQRQKLQVQTSPESKSSPPPKPKTVVVKKYPLSQLQEATANKTLKGLGVDPENIQDHLRDSDFTECFDMSRTDFLLKPLWRQKALKRSAGLF